MNAANASRVRRGSIAAVAAAVGLLSVAPGSGAAHAAPHVAGRGTHCPAAESLVPHRTWHHRTLARGLQMSSAIANDALGSVYMHVLRINLADKNLALQPLMTTIAERSPLSTLTHGHPHLVAATNTGYFDFRTGAPTQPLIVGKLALVMSKKHQAVVGLNSKGLMQSGLVWWAAVMTAGKQVHSVVSKNTINPPDGISVYTPIWGSQPLPGSWHSVMKTVVKGVVTGTPQNQGNVTVPSGGEVLVANGRTADTWLAAVP
jgi:hypothetical protein